MGWGETPPGAPAGHWDMPLTNPFYWISFRKTALHSTEGGLSQEFSPPPTAFWKSPISTDLLWKERQRIFKKVNGNILHSQGHVLSLKPERPTVNYLIPSNSTPCVWGKYKTSSKDKLVSQPKLGAVYFPTPLGGPKTHRGVCFRVGYGKPGPLRVSWGLLRTYLRGLGQKGLS